MNDQQDQNMSRIIFDNFDLKEFGDREPKYRSFFLRKATFSFRKLASYRNAFRTLLEKLKIRSPILIKRSALAETPFTLDINDLLGTEFDLINVPYVCMMPIKTIDLNARDKYFLKQKLNLLFEFHLHIMFDERSNGEFLSMIDEEGESLDCNPLLYLDRLRDALATIEVDEYCEYLRNLYYQDLYSLEFINLKIKGRETLPYYQNTREDMQIIYETLETAVQSRSYHKIFKSILHTNQISNTTLNDEICLFTTNWTYSKAILRSLRDEICSFIQLNQPTTNQPSERNQSSTKRQLLANLNELNEHFQLFGDLDEQPKRTRKTKANQLKSVVDPQQYFSIARLLNKTDNLFEFYLNELSFLTVDLTRDLLIYLTNNIADELKSKTDSNVDDQSDDYRPKTSEQLNQPPVFQLLMFDNRKKESRYSLNVHTDLQNASNARFLNQLKSKLQAFINQLYHRKLLKKHLLSLNHEPDVEMYLNTIWQSVIAILRSLNNIDQSFLAEIFLANKRHLQSSSSFIARKYLYYIIRNLFETLYLVCSTIYDKFPVRLTTSELQKNKSKLDSLIDQAFLIHLKNEILIMLADADPSIQVERPVLTKFINEKITRQNITEILSQLISLIRVKLLHCTFYSSPLYTEFVKINEKFKKMDDCFDKQMNVNLFKVLNLDRKSGVIKDPAKVITDIIENEILMRYLNLTPRLECLEQVAEIGAQIVLELGMKKNLYFNN